MGRGSAISRSTTPPTPDGPRPLADSRDRQARDPWTPSSSRDLIAAVALIAVLMAILVVYTHDVPQAPRTSVWDPVPWARTTARTAPVDWNAIPVTERLSTLGPTLEKAIADKVSRERHRVARCLREVDPPAGGGTEIVLRLAPRSSTLNVEGVEAGGPETPPSVVECARRALDGDPIPAQGLVPGRRYRVRVALR